MAQHEHFLEQHDPDRKDFQIDRIILFSDAVFAIAITLLIIEIKAPAIVAGSTNHQIIEQLLHLIPEFIAFIISFFVIAVYWRSHHRIFGFVSGYSHKLIWINMYFLFTIVLMPFSAAYYSRNFGYNIPYVFYNINIIVTGIINYYYVRHVFNPKNNLVKHQPTPMFIHLFKARAITIPIFFTCVVLLTPLSFMPTPIIYFLIWPTFFILRKVIARKYKDVLPVKARHAKHKA